MHFQIHIHAQQNGTRIVDLIYVVRLHHEVQEKNAA
jgi:hypothetical protein